MKPLIDIKKTQNTAIETLFFNYNFNSKTSLNDYVKTWDELTDYHYKFYTQKQISYKEQRKRRIVDLFKKYNIPLLAKPLDIYKIYLNHFEKKLDLF